MLYLKLKVTLLNLMKMVSMLKAPLLQYINQNYLITLK
nr:MAG TPA: hypothetical protein [Caudoviricetes sp.]